MTAEDRVDPKDFAELAGVVMGTRQTALEGDGRNSDGLVHDVAWIKERLGNGGIRLKLSPAQWTFLTAVVGLLTAIVFALNGGDPSALTAP